MATRWRAVPKGNPGALAGNSSIDAGKRGRLSAPQRRYVRRWLPTERSIPATIALALLAKSLLVYAGGPQLTAVASTYSPAGLHDANAARPDLDALRGQVYG